MLKPIQKNPYREDTSSGSIWAMGFYAGQRSMSATVSVTGRWWQSRSGKVFFAEPYEYEAIQRSVNNSPDLYLWLTEEETREF